MHDLTFLFHVACLVLSSVGRSVVAKSCTQLRAHGIATYHAFNKPLLLTLLLFIGMSAALVFTLAPRRRFRDRKGSDDDEPLADEADSASASSSSGGGLDPSLRAAASASTRSIQSISDVRCNSRPFWLPALSAVLEIAAALLFFKSLVSLPATLNEMVQVYGDFLASAVLSLATRSTDMSVREGVGAALCTAGMVAACVTHMEHVGLLRTTPAAATKATDAAALALFLVVPRALVSGVQQLVDARLMQSTRMDAAVLVGVRGVHGIWLCIPLLLLADHALPGDAYEGRLESTVDSLRMLRHSQALFLMLLVFVSTVCAQQYFHERVRAQNPNEMTRALWRNARAPIVWLASLLLWWSTPPRWRVGEPLPPRAVILGRAGGIVLLLVGAAVFYAEQAGAQFNAIVACWESPLPWRAKVALCVQCCCRDCGRDHSSTRRAIGGGDDDADAEGGDDADDDGSHFKGAVLRERGGGGSASSSSSRFRGDFEDEDDDDNGMSEEIIFDSHAIARGEQRASGFGGSGGDGSASGAAAISQSVSIAVNGEAAFATRSPADAFRSTMVAALLSNSPPPRPSRSLQPQSPPPPPQQLQQQQQMQQQPPQQVAEAWRPPVNRDLFGQRVDAAAVTAATAAAEFDDDDDGVEFVSATAARPSPFD